MVKTKLQRIKKTNNDFQEESVIYDHYVSLDWSQNNMAIARMTLHSNQVKVIDVPSDIEDLKLYLKNLKGSKILTIEETNTTQWLYVELKDYADYILVCDPYRNRLLSEGAKNDKIDAEKLCKLLRSGLLKEVYHSTSDLYDLRKLYSAYDDLVKAGVRLQNQKSAIYRSGGKKVKTKDTFTSATTEFILKYINEGVEGYEKTKKEFEKFIHLKNNHDNLLKHQKTIPGIGDICALKIVSTVVDANRFRNTGKYLSYCGLVRHKKMSGNIYYGQKKTRYSRRVKSAYKTAANSAIGCNNPINEYYEYLLCRKGLSEDKARNQIARYIARISYGMLKSGKKYEPYRWRKNRID